MTEQVLLGDPFDKGTTMRPVNNEQVAAKIGPLAARHHRRAAVDRGGFPTDL